MKGILPITFIFFSVYGYSQEKRSEVQKVCAEAKAAYEANEYAKALEMVNKCLEEDPGNADAYLTRAATREQLNDLKGANTDYSIYNEMKPDDSDALFSLAVIRYRIALHEQSKADFLRLLKMPHGETNTVYFRVSTSTTGANQVTTKASGMDAMIFNYLGLVETKLGHFPEAVHWLDSAIAMQGKEADYYVNRGLAREALKDTAAYKDYEKALIVNPDHAAARANLSNRKRNSGNAEGSMDEIEKAIESDSSMLHPYLSRAFQRMEGGYYKGALEDYNHALEIDSTKAEIWMNRGISREKLNDLKGAFADYTIAIELDEKYEKAWLSRGNVLIKLSRFKEAAEDYTVAILFNPEFAYAYYNRAIAYQKQKMPSEACADLTKAESLGYAVSDRLKKDVCK